MRHFHMTDSTSICSCVKLYYCVIILVFVDRATIPSFCGSHVVSVMWLLSNIFHLGQDTRETQGGNGLNAIWPFRPVDYRILLFFIVFSLLFEMRLARGSAIKSLETKCSFLCLPCQIKLLLRRVCSCSVHLHFRSLCQNTALTINKHP